jgi:transcriptional regulator with XRE-family HTH domain
MRGNKIGRVIRSIRLSKGITATFMANRLGYKSVSSYTRLEKGESTISVEQAKMIADLLSVNLNDFFYEEKLRESHKIDSA